MISGKARAGKDTLALALKKDLELKGKTVKIISLADDLKEKTRNAVKPFLKILNEEKKRIKNIVRQETGLKLEFNEISTRDFYDKKTDISRGLITTCGKFTDLIDPDYYSKIILEQANDMNNGAEFIIVPDLRFMKEYIFFKQRVPSEFLFTIRLNNKSIDTSSIQYDNKSEVEFDEEEKLFNFLSSINHYDDIPTESRYISNRILKSLENVI